MLRTRTPWLAAAHGLLAVIVGVLVLRSPGAQPGIGWFSYGGPPSPALLDSLVAWNAARGFGAVLVLVGLLVVAHVLGRSAEGRREPGPRPLAGRVLVLAAVLVLGGLLAFVLLGRVDRFEATVSISKVADAPPPVVFASTVWTHTQAVAALVVAIGLLVGAVGTGLRWGRPKNAS